MDAKENRSRTISGQLTLSVGPEDTDLTGTDDKVLQAGLDYLHRLGGGTLEIRAGQYTMRNALYLRPGVALRGAGKATVLKKAPSTCTPLDCDSDWYEAQIRVEDPTGFSPVAVSCPAEVLPVEGHIELKSIAVKRDSPLNIMRLVGYKICS